MACTAELPAGWRRCPKAVEHSSRPAVRTCSACSRAQPCHTQTPPYYSNFTILSPAMFHCTVTLHHQGRPETCCEKRATVSLSISHITHSGAEFEFDHDRMCAGAMHRPQRLKCRMLCTLQSAPRVARCRLQHASHAAQRKTHSMRYARVCSAINAAAEPAAIAGLAHKNAHLHTPCMAVITKKRN